MGVETGEKSPWILKFDIFIGNIHYWQPSGKNPFDAHVRERGCFQLNIQYAALLCKGLRFAPIPNWTKSVENAEWLNVQQHVRRTEWRAVLGDKKDADFVLPKKLTIPKTSRPDSTKIDEKKQNIRWNGLFKIKEH